MQEQLHRSTKIDNLVNATKFRSIFFLKIFALMLVLSLASPQTTMRYNQDNLISSGVDTHGWIIFSQ